MIKEISVSIGNKSENWDSFGNSLEKNTGGKIGIWNFGMRRNTSSYSARTLIGRKRGGCRLLFQVGRFKNWVWSKKKVILQLPLFNMFISMLINKMNKTS